MSDAISSARCATPSHAQPRAPHHAHGGGGRAPPQFEGVRYNPTTNRWMAFVRGPRGHEYFLGWFDSDLEVRDAASV